MESLEKYYFSYVSTDVLEKIRIVLCLLLLIPYFDHFLDPSLFLSFEGWYFGFRVPDSAAFFLAVVLFVFLTFSLVGFLTRISLIVTAVLHYYFNINGYYPMWGWGLFGCIFIIALIFSNTVSRWSVDYHVFPANRRSHSWIFPLRWFQLQVSLLYLSITIKRLPEESWRQGQALQGILESRIFSRLSAFDLEPYAEVLRFFSNFSWATEFLGCLAIFLGTQARWLAYLLISVHAVVALVAPVGQWQFLMILAWTTFLIKSESAGPETLWVAKIKKPLIYFMFILTAVSYIVGLFSLERVQKALHRNWLGAGLVFSMMDRPPRFSLCLFIDEVKGSRIAGNIYHTDWQRCLGSKFFWEDDLILNATARDFVRVYGKINRRNPHPEVEKLIVGNIQRRVARAFCKSSHPPEAVQISVLMVPQKKSLGSHFEWKDFGRFRCDTWEPHLETLENEFEHLEKREKSIRDFLDNSESLVI